MSNHGWWFGNQRSRNAFSKTLVAETKPEHYTDRHAVQCYDKGTKGCKCSKKREKCLKKLYIMHL